MRFNKYGDAKAGGTRKGEVPQYLQSVVLEYDGDDCLIWPYHRNGNGYGMIRFDGINTIVSRLVCERVHGPAPTISHEAAHSCGRGHDGCVTKRHLLWKTRIENSADKLVHGTHNRGENCITSKVTEQDVREIRALHGRVSLRELADRYGVSMSHISTIQSRKRWAWLEE